MSLMPIRAQWAVWPFWKLLIMTIKRELYPIRLYSYNDDLMITTWTSPLMEAVVCTLRVSVSVFLFLILLCFFPIYINTNNDNGASSIHLSSTTVSSLNTTTTR
eukprot:GHVR01172892.1.p1 GENE.GHVR01172892.1~~GHVR01172892.1.p1  ORF type:complete len:104 (+),score=10.66 GHVR01172892.1:183-494(+)